MANYETADFNDPAVCEGVDPTDFAKMEQEKFLFYLRNGLARGLVEPNSACLQTLTSISKQPLPWASPHLYTKTTANEILNGFFYQLELPSPQSSPLVGESKSSLPSLLSSTPRNNNYLTTEYTGLQPDLAGILGDCYSTCGILTEDGKYCGLGENDGFRFPYPELEESNSPLSLFSNCHHECASDLCPQWMKSLTEHIPTVVTITNLTTGKATNAAVDSVEIESGDDNFHWTFANVYNGKSDLTAGDVVGACRVLNQGRRIALIMTVTLKPEETEQFSHFGENEGAISFPEFVGGKYFVGDNSRWSYYLGRCYATLVIPPRA